MSSRRSFLKKAAAATAAIGFGNIPTIQAKQNLIKITILHTNDVHSRIEPFPDNDAKYPGMGGAALRSSIIKSIRQQEEHVLLFDSGDIFQGTPYFNFYLGEPELKLMSKMGYDAATIGNHDFDNGVEGLARQLPNAAFPFICANYDFRGTAMEGKTIPYKVFEKGGIRIGVFGLGIELKGLVPEKLYNKTVYLNPSKVSAQMAYHLRHKEKCNLVVCLSHLGFKYKEDKISDVVLAKQSLNIDLILGGHTHTFIDIPYTYYNRDNKPLLIAQAGWAGLRLGRIDFYFERKSKLFAYNGDTVKIMRKPS
ncbi:MAG: metallophosphatase [Bacteroidia bacterium]|nr:metallophosphatase [Bacteroidia bacterium]MCZ2277411.1 metallophosphatase [Bacteroidia bacterium]